MGFFLSLHRSGGDAFDDEAGEDDVDGQHRQDGQEDEHVDLAQIELGVLPLVPDGQLRMAQRLQRTLRPGLRGLPHRKPHL